jgi:hypothetical protein
MVKSFYLCEVCGTYHDTLENAIRCEIRRHNPDAPAPVARDQFHTIPQVAAMTGIKPSRIAMWIVRHGRIFEHMIDRKSQTDHEWCISEGRAGLLTAHGTRARYLVPSRDVDAMQKAIRLFDTGHKFNTGNLGAIVVHSESGGSFRVPK